MLHRAGLIAVVLLALVALALPVSAQDAPAAVTAALNSLNAKLGTSLALSDLDNWQWSQQNFPDRSLGCPLEGYTYTQNVTNGTIVSLAYNGIQYDFRVYTGSLQVFECSANSGAPGGTPGPSGAQTATPAGTLVPAAVTPTPTSAPVTTGSVVCTGGLPTRFAVGMRGVSIATGSINVRNPADLDDPNAVKGLLLPGGEFEVTGGPQCNDNRTWWEIRYETVAGTIAGWVIEGDNIDYWLEPLGSMPQTDAPSPTVNASGDPRMTITADNVNQIKLWTRIPVEEGIVRLAFLPRPHPDAILIDPAGQMHYYAGANVVRVEASLNHLGLLAEYVVVGRMGTSLFTFATLERDPNMPGSSVLYVSQITGPSPLIVSELYGYQLPQIPNMMAISADGSMLAASSGTLPDEVLGTGVAPNLVWLWNLSTGQQLPTIQLDGPAADLAFSPDGRYLAITQPGAGVYLWSVEPNQELTLLFNAPNWHGTTSMAFSPDGALLAVGTTDGKVILYDLTDPATVQPRSVIQVVLDADVRFVAFNRDGSLLATGATLPENDVTQAPARNAGITVWRTSNGGRLIDLTTDSLEPLTGLAFRGDDTQLIATGTSNWWSWGVF